MGNYPAGNPFVVDNVCDTNSYVLKGHLKATHILYTPGNPQHMTDNSGGGPYIREILI